MALETTFHRFSANFLINGIDTPINLLVPQPYEHTFEVNAKQRWIGRSVIDIFSTEFGAYSDDYYKEAIESGRLTIRGKKVTAEQKLTSRDRLEHKVLFIEAPILDDPVKILFENDDVIAAYKPPSIPSHPQGKYRKGSLTWIVREYHLKNHDKYLHPVNRLDRTTSGVVILAKSTEAYKKYAALISDKRTSKFYIAKAIRPPCASSQVEGAAVTDQTYAPTHTTPSGPSKWEKFFASGSVKEISLPIAVKKHAEGMHLTVEPSANCEQDASSTQFAPFEFAEPSLLPVSWVENAQTDVKPTLILCRPLTGRTHQIRAHLAALGAPIWGDATYQNNADFKTISDDGKFIGTDWRSGKAETVVQNAPYVPEWQPSQESAEDFVTWSKVEGEDGSAGLKLIFNMEKVGELDGCLHAAEYIFDFESETPVPLVGEGGPEEGEGAKRQALLANAISFATPDLPSWAQ